MITMSTGFAPSTYQQAIFDFVQRDLGLVAHIEAALGLSLVE